MQSRGGAIFDPMVMISTNYVEPIRQCYIPNILDLGIVVVQTLWGGANFDNRGLIFTNLVEVLKLMLQLYGLRFVTRRFVKFFSFRLPWQPDFCMELIFSTNLEKDHARIILVKFHQNPTVGLLEDDFVNC